MLQNSNLENFYKIADGVYRSDQPSKKDFKLLEEYGIREVLNLRNYHNDSDEARGTNLKLHHLRSKAGSMSENDLVKALQIIKNRKGPVLIHCWHGSDRTGAVVAMYRMVFQNVAKDEAIREMTEGGFGYHKIYDNLIETLKNIDIESFKKRLEL